MPAPNLFPDFQTFLFPSFDNGNIDFIKYSASGSTPGDGQVIKFPFVRPNTAEDGTKSGTTRINKDGIIESLNANDPVWDFTSGCSVLKMLPQSKNILSNSESFASYYTLSCTKTDLGAFAHRASADLALFTATGAVSRFGARNSATVNGQKYTHSFYVDLNQGGRYVGILSGSTGAVDCLDEVVLSSGGIGLTAKFTTIADGIKYVQLTFTADAAGNCFNIITTAAGATGTTNETVAATCFQIKTGEGTPYIPTEGVALTRSSSSFSKSGLIASNIFNQTEGVLLLKAKSNLSFSGVSADSDLLTLKKDGANQLRLRGQSAGHYLEALGLGGASPQIPFIGNRYLLINFGENEAELYGDGVFIDAAALPDLTGIDSLEFLSPFVYDIEMIAIGRYKLAQDQCISHSTIY